MISQTLTNKTIADFLSIVSMKLSRVPSSPTRSSPFTIDEDIVISCLLQNLNYILSGVYNRLTFDPSKLSMSLEVAQELMSAYSEFRNFAPSIVITELNNLKIQQIFTDIEDDVCSNDSIFLYLTSKSEVAQALENSSTSKDENLDKNYDTKYF